MSSHADSNVRPAPDQELVDIARYVAAGQSFVMESSFVSTAAVSVIAATTSHAFTALEA